MKFDKINKNLILKRKGIKVRNSDNSNEEDSLESKYDNYYFKKRKIKKKNKNNNDKSYGKYFRLLNRKADKNNNIQASIKKVSKKKKSKFIFILIFLCFMITITILAINIFTRKNFKEIFPIFRPPTLLNIYICTHKDFWNNITSPAYKILCDDKSELKQEYNLTIIETNKDNILYPKRVGYSEGSKIFHIWKLYKEGNLNFIVKSRFVYEVTVREHFYEHHIGHFLDESLDIIKEKFPEYYQSALSFLKKKYANFCNIFIMKKEDFIKWGEFVFGVLIEFDRRYNLTTDDDIRKLIKKEAKKSNKPLDIDFQSRLQAYLSERISNFFYEHHFKKIYEITTLDLF